LKAKRFVPKRQETTELTGDVFQDIPILIREGPHGAAIELATRKRNLIRMKLREPAIRQAVTKDREFTNLLTRIGIFGPKGIRPSV